MSAASTSAGPVPAGASSGASSGAGSGTGSGTTSGTADAPDGAVGQGASAPSQPAAEPAAPAPPAGEIPAPIIVKKITIEGGGHHGGAWKVAYADFVTAMMAFFLLMWLLGATDEQARKGIADHFTPTLLKLRKGSAGSNGVLGGSSIAEADNYPNRQGQTGDETISVPRIESGGAGKEGTADSKDGMRHRVMRDKIEKALGENENEKMRRLIKQVRVLSTPEGVRIDLVDDADFSMFALGTTALTRPARQLLQVVGGILREENANLTVRGHTDSLPWKPGLGANNWSLSAGRAEATRQALLLNDIDEARFRRIEGVADRELLIKDNPKDPRNRRMSILLLK